MSETCRENKCILYNSSWDRQIVKAIELKPNYIISSNRQVLISVCNQCLARLEMKPKCLSVWHDQILNRICDSENKYDGTINKSIKKVSRVNYNPYYNTAACCCVHSYIL